MDFGLYIRSAQTFDKMVNLAKLAEELGYHGVFLNDHVHGFADDGREPYLEAWTAMTGVGVMTRRIRVGHIVLFNSLRNPAFLAKSISTLDQMTGGRYELLIGAGWNESEYVGYDLMGGGRGMPPAGERVDRLVEALNILRLMLHQEVTDFEGKYWKLQGAINVPLPIQKPFKIYVGGSKPRMRRVAAELSDGMNISVRGFSKVQEVMDSFAKEVERLGRDMGSYYMSGFDGVRIAKDSEEADEMCRELATRLDSTPSEIRREHLVGTPEELVEKLRRLRDIGISMMVVSPVYRHGDPVSEFVDSVMKNL